MFGALGTICGLTGSKFGAYLGSPWVVVPLALFFVAMGLSMFGAFEIALPSGLQQRLSRVGGRGFGGAFLMGLVGGIIAAPCTGPPLARAAGLRGDHARRRSGGSSRSRPTARGVGVAALAAGGVLGVDAAAGRLDGLGQELLRHPAFHGRALLPEERGPGAGALHVGQTPRFAARDGGDDRRRASRWAPFTRASTAARSRRLRKVCGVALVTVGCSAHQLRADAQGRRSQLAWLTDEKAALADARAAGRPRAGRLLRRLVHALQGVGRQGVLEARGRRGDAPLHAPAGRPVEGRTTIAGRRAQISRTLRRRDAAAPSRRRSSPDRTSSCPPTDRRLADRCP